MGRFRIREDHAKEFNVKLVKLTSFLLYLLHSLHKFDIYFHRKEFRRISRPNSLMNTCFFSSEFLYSQNKRFALYPENLNSCLPSIESIQFTSIMGRNYISSSSKLSNKFFLHKITTNNEPTI